MSVFDSLDELDDDAEPTFWQRVRTGLSMILLMLIVLLLQPHSLKWIFRVLVIIGVMLVVRIWIEA